MKLSDIRFLIPAITLAGDDLVNVIGYIQAINYNFESGQGVLILRVGESVNSQILYNAEVPLVLDQSGAFGAQDMINAVLTNIPNSSIISNE